LHPDFSRFSAEANPEIWRDRIIIWLAAMVAGLFVVGFVWLTDQATDLFRHAITHRWWLPLIITPSGGMLVVWLTRTLAPGAAGSGIPQVIAALEPDLPTEKTALFVSLRLSLAKTLLGAGTIAAGFSSGREGPSVQIAAGVMLGFHRFIKRKVAIKPRDLILAGGAAGIAAAFNTPLAGIIFAIEELGKRFEHRSSGLLISAIVLAGVVSISLMGNFNYFGRIDLDNISVDLLWPSLLVTFSVAISGGFFSRLLVNSFLRDDWKINQWRARHPIWFAGACGALVAVLGLISEGTAFGSGYLWTRQILASNADVAFDLSSIYFATKFVATWLSFWSGVPGGIFAPALAIGAGVGHDVAMLTGATAAPLIALGMTGFLAAVTQSPITAFIIIMEMTDGHTGILSLMAVSLASSVISRFISAPLYPTLATIQLRRAALN